jgi:hypothetical protein
MAQAVNPWLPIAVARVESQVRTCGICGERSGAGVDFLQVLLIPPTPPYTSKSSCRLTPYSLDTDNVVK